MRKLWIDGAFEFRNNTVGQHLAEFDTPLVERVDIPDGALDKDLVFVERDELAQRLRCEPFCENGVRWAVALECAMRYLKGRDSVCRNFLSSFAESKCLGLGKEVGHQEIMMPP